jgi:hypothetical protein
MEGGAKFIKHFKGGENYKSLGTPPLPTHVGPWGAQQHAK